MMHDGTISEITGTETRAKDGSPLDARIEFYRAFNAGDLDALAANWADGDAPSMDNPIGGIRRGWPAIREGYSDRKSTRLNSSHLVISYAVFCLKKKKIRTLRTSVESHTALQQPHVLTLRVKYS